MRVDTGQKADGDAASPPAKRLTLFLRSFSHRWLPIRSKFGKSISGPVILCCLIVIALLPRFILARQLDLVTDEIVYILGGKIYFPLLQSFSIGVDGWKYNYEHPPLVKLLIGLTIFFNAGLPVPLRELLAARIPSVLFGTGLVVALYYLGKAPFGKIVAGLAALSLALSPWFVYFSSLAYLDMTMTALVTVAYLVLWYAPRRPWLYLVVAVLVGLATASKYTAVLVVPGMVIFTLYSFFFVRLRRPPDQREKVPWLWWLGAVVLSPLIFLAADPAIWPDPIGLLQRSFQFEWEHSYAGHLTFLAGQYANHVPGWAIFYILLAKISAFVTVPAVLFVVLALVHLGRFHFHRPGSQILPEEAGKTAFLLVWLLATLGMFSLLNIVVGTHYHLTLAAPIALAGASGLVMLVGYATRYVSFLRKRVWPETNSVPADHASSPGLSHLSSRKGWNLAILALLAILLAGSHLIGLTTVHAAEGYTSEFFSGEDTALQVAYPAYREAVQWIAIHDRSPGQAKVGLITLGSTLKRFEHGIEISWHGYNRNLANRFQLAEVHAASASFSYDYLVWPMHLVQRGYVIPEAWRTRVVHVIMGGNTTYSYILAWDRSIYSP